MLTSNMTSSNTKPPSDASPPARGLPVTTFAVLGQIAQGATTGYEVKAGLRQGAAQFWHASYSQIYAELRRLHGLGFVTEEPVIQEGRPNKRVHRITPAGRDALIAWLGEPWGLAHLRDASLVKLTLADPLADELVTERLRGLREQHARRLAEFEREIAGLGAGASPYLRLALRKGVRAQAAFLAWCDEAIAELGEAPESP